MRVLTAEDNTGSKRVTTALTYFSTRVPAQRRAKVLTEAEPLLNAHIHSKEIWTALQLADYKKEGVLNDVAVNVLFANQQTLFKNLLLVNSAEELQALCDEDEDGFLNEDEQILIFSLIKERMQTAAEELCAIHEYQLYKTMMQSIRALEGDILEYQEKMRRRNHSKELSAYHETGMEKLQKFKEDWDRRFQSFQMESQAKMEALKTIHEEQMQRLNEKTQKDVEFVKVKPKARMRDLQTKEKLVAINERYSEAQQIRNELEVLEVDEQNRVENKILLEQETKRKKLKRQQDKEVSELQLKNQTVYFALKIKMDQEYSRMQKEIKLYLNDITKNQNTALRLARKLGETRDELRRTKKKSRLLMQFLTEAKSIPSSRLKTRPNEGMQAGPSHLSPIAQGRQSVVSSVAARARTTSPLIRNRRNVTNFQIAGKMRDGGSPLNSPGGIGTGVVTKGKLSTFSHNRFKDPLQSLGGLYDVNLEPVKVEVDKDEFVCTHR